MRNYHDVPLNNIKKTMNDKEAHYKKMNNSKLYTYLYNMAFVLVIVFLVCN